MRAVVARVEVDEPANKVEAFLANMYAGIEALADGAEVAA